MLPDDRWSQNITVKINATKAAPASGLSKRTLILKKPGTEIEYTTSWDVTFNYLGATITIEPSINSIKAYSTRVTIPNIAVGNNSTDATLYNMWLYVEGSVKNISLKGSGKTIQGEGFQDRWIPLGDVAGNTSTDYSLDFDFTGTSEDIRIYSVSGYNDNTWIAPTEAELSTQALGNYLGGNTTIRVTMANPRLAGSIRISDPMIEHEEPYTLTLTIDGTQSEGLIRNPKTTLVVPRGQYYQPNTAFLTYNGKTVSLNDLFNAENDPVAPEEHTVTIDLKTVLGESEILFPGFLSGDPDSKRKAVITADFAPLCNSDLKGMRYTGLITGLNAGGNNAPSHNLNSPSLLPENAGDYAFSVNTQMYRAAFNQWQPTGEWQVTIRKITGPDADLAVEDYLLLELPDAMDIDGTIRMNSSDIAGLPATTNHEDVSIAESGKRTIKVTLPIEKINDSGNKGQGKDITFTIPMKLTGAANVPLHLLTATMVSMTKFGDCPAWEGSVGSGATSVAILPVGATDYQVSVGEKIDLTVAANGLSGSWYADEALTTEIEDTEGETTYVYTPQADDFQGKDLTNGEEVTFWVAALFPNSDEPTLNDDYGKVPVKVTVYPALTFEIRTLSVICGSKNFNLADLIRTSTIAEGVTVTLYADEECTSAISFPYKVENSHSVWARAANNIFKGKPQEIEFIVNEPVMITDDLKEETLYLDFGGKTTLRVAASGDNVEYTWFSGDVGGTDYTPISGAESASLEVSTSGEYYVIIDGCNQKQSKTTTVIICPKLELTIDSDMPTAYCTTSEDLQDGIRLADYLKNTNTEFTYWYKTEGGSYEEITNDIYLPKEAGETKYSIVARNKAGSETAAKELAIKVELPLAITEHPQDKTILIGETASLTVVAEGSNLGYQWQKKNAGGDFEDLSGATEATYNTTEAGDYRVLVTGSTTGCGTETLESDPATVTVRIPVQPEEELRLVTWEANWSGVVELSIYNNSSATVNSGDYVDRGTRLVVQAHPGMAGLTLVKLAVNGEEIVDGGMITINENTHIVATFELGDIDPNPDPVGNTSINNDLKLWSAGGQLYIETSTPIEAVIYTVTGQLTAKRQVTTSDSFHLPSGPYVVKAGDRIYKVVVR